MASYKLRDHLGTFTAPLAIKHGTRPAVRDDGATPGLHPGGIRTFADLESAVAIFAAAHAALGRVEGDRVLIAIDNRIDTLLHASALARLGAVPALVNPRLTPAEAAHIAQATSAVGAVGDSDVLARLELADVVACVSTEELGASLTSRFAEGSLVAVAPEVRDPDEVCLLLATSGTTGKPKAAALTSAGLLSMAGLLGLLPVGRSTGLRAGRDRLLAPLPIAHVMGFAVLLNALVAGVEVLHRARFDPVDVLDTIEHLQPNIVVMVPTMYADLEAAGADARDLRSVQVWASAADAMPDARARRFQRRGGLVSIAGRRVGRAAFVDGYGMVELSGLAALRIFPPTIIDLPAIAVVKPGLEVRTVDKDRKPCRPGAIGELEFRGGGVLRGYEGRPDAGPDADGWFATGDRARLWPGRLLQFAGREKDRLKVGGFSVFPAEVEQALLTGPGVREVAVVGLPDDRLGDRIVAMVVAEPGFSASSFLAFSRDAVAGYRRPHGVLTVDAIPRGNNAKVDRDKATDAALAMVADGLLVEA
ncbi:MAG: long-chain acyl-CoA synthetase [Nitriliruptoraceae bacterium]|jgi:long-chain acyl-CoA synthetase